MAKYFMQGKYTPEGVKGFIKEGGSSRQEAIEKLFASVGGSLESLYFSSAGPGYYIIVNMPDKESAIAMAATAVSTGAITADQMVELITPAEADEAVKKSPMYRAPGQ